MLDLLLGCQTAASSYLVLKVYSLFNNEVTVNAFIHRYFDISCIGMFLNIQRIQIKLFFSKKANCILSLCCHVPFKNWGCSFPVLPNSILFHTVYKLDKSIAILNLYMLITNIVMLHIPINKPKLNLTFFMKLMLS